MEHDNVTTPDEVLDFCERSDRILQLVLGSTPERTARRFGMVLVLAVAAAVVASVAQWLWR